MRQPHASAQECLHHLFQTMRGRKLEKGFRISFRHARSAPSVREQSHCQERPSRSLATNSSRLQSAKMPACMLEHTPPSKSKAQPCSTCSTCDPPSKLAQDQRYIGANLQFQFVHRGGVVSSWVCLYRSIRLNECNVRPLVNRTFAVNQKNPKNGLVCA